MKTVFTVILGLVLFTTSAALAGDETKTKETKKKNSAVSEKVKKNQAASTEDKGGTLLTGSYMKQKVNRAGRITDGASQVIVLDRDMIERSGASDLKQLLTHQGIH